VDLELLAETPRALDAAYRDLAADRFDEAPSDGAWSPAQIVEHICAADAVFALRFLQVLVRPDVPLVDLDERRVAEILDRAHTDMADRLAMFRASRGHLVALLGTLTREEQELAGVHETRGSVTIADLCTTVATHEAEHLEQLADAVSVLSHRGGS
jgi:hypothetical protein